ncbi:MAG: T9SS type A sorting domain-containing protein, partial [Saprospiraceae bacterium]|nr:T9SS type A sorting domain-containing protein [Saprospiraceae bacterium]
LYIVTDSVNVILKTQLSDTFNFEGSPAGQCLIYAMTYEGVISNTEAGNNITDLEGCFALSSPFGIFRSTAFPGMISVNQQQSITICNQDSIDLLDIELVNAEAESESWIVTNIAGEIIEFNVSEPIDISSYAPGSYQIYHLAYSGAVSALTIGENINNLSGCIGISNALDVEKVNVEGGEFSIVGGATEIEICSKAIVDAFDVELSGAAGDTSVFVLTNADGVIIDLPENTPIDFNESTSEECFLWVLSYSDISGLSIGNHIDDLEGCYAFSNAITITKVLLDAGFLALSNNSACVGDGVPDLVGGNIFNAAGPVSQLIITDNDSIILDVINQFPFDVENASGGTCLVFHVSSLDTLELLPGMNVNDINVCHDISNGGVVLRTDIHAGEISLDDGGTSIHICVSDTISDVLSFINTSTAGKNIQYVVTDTNNVILALPDSSVVDFSISPPGICLVWAVSYTGNFVAMVGETLGQMPPSDGCVDITDNYVEVARDSVGGPCDPECIVDGGFVDLFGNEYCIGDGIEDFVIGSVQNALGLYQQILLTDTAGIILAVSDSVNFEVDGADPGTCLVWNLAALDTIQLNAGMSIDSIDSNCFDLSPPASFNRLNPEGGVISYPGGDTLTQTICVGDSIPDVLVFIRDTVTIPLYKYIIANEENIVIAVAPNNSFNFENLLPGICKVYGVSYSGLFTLSQGDTLFVDPPATGCFDYSDNCLNIVKEDCSTTSCPVDGGSLELSTNFVCVSDGVDDLVDGDVQNAIGDYSTYIITDTDSIIIGNPPNFPINFESAGGGICLVWHMSAMDSIPLNMGDHINSITDCHDLSEPETIERVDNNGGSVSLENGDTIIEICVGDSVANELVFSTSGFSVNYEYIITDTFDVIIEVVDNNIIDFENAPAGVCRVYGLAHNDVFDQTAGDTLELPDNPGTCFDLSDNFVEVIRIDSGAPCTNKLTGSEIVFAINPNPSTGYINLEFESIPELKADISIFNSHGVKQYHEMIEGVTQYNELQLPEFAPGTYFVRVRSQSKVLTKKFLVVR